MRPYVIYYARRETRDAGTDACAYPLVRVHAVGCRQTRVVHIYRLVSAGCVEQRLVERSQVRPDGGLGPGTWPAPEPTRDRPPILTCRNRGRVLSLLFACWSGLWPFSPAEV